MYVRLSEVLGTVMVGSCEWRNERGALARGDKIKVGRFAAVLALASCLVNLVRSTTQTQAAYEYG